MQNQNLRRDFQPKPQSTKPKRNSFKTFLKWMAIGIGVPFALFVTLGIAGVWDGTPKQQAQWKQERLARAEAQKPAQTYDPTTQTQTNTPASTIVQETSAPQRISIRGMAVVTQSDEVDLNARPNVRYAVAGAACDEAYQLDRWHALNDINAPGQQHFVEGCMPLPVGQKLVVVREFGDTASVLVDLGGGVMMDAWIIGPYAFEPAQYAEWMRKIETENSG